MTAEDLLDLLMTILMISTAVLSLGAMLAPGLHKRRFCLAWVIMSLGLLGLGYSILFRQTWDIYTCVTGGLWLVFHLIYYRLFTRLYKDCSRVILGCSLLLTGLGILLMARLDTDLAMKQLIIGMTAFIPALLIPTVIKHFRAMSRFALIYGALGLGLLVLVWRLGSTTYGAQLSFDIGPVTLQPSELVKISFVFFAASMFREKQSFGRALLTTVIAAAHVLVLAASTDLGSGLVYFMSYIFMLYVATHRKTYLALGLAAGSAAAVGAYFLFSHVQVRVAAWLDPLADYETKGYQLCQSLFGISTGGYTGLGLGQGRPEYIPLVRNDYIFAEVCEELGVLAGICLIIIYLALLVQYFEVSLRLKSPFYQILGVGFAAMTGTQIFLHIGGVTGMIPATGITLPFVSYGGTSLVSTVIITGVIQGLYISTARRARDRSSGEKAGEGITYPGIDCVPGPLSAESDVSTPGEGSEPEYEAFPGERQEPIPRLRSRRGLRPGGIYVTGIIFTLLFTGMIVYLICFMETSSASYAGHAYNRLQDLAAVLS